MMTQQIEHMLKESKATIKLIVKDLREGKEYFNVSGREQMVSASLIKVPILVAALQHYEQEGILLSTKLSVTEQDCVEYSTIAEEGEKEYTIKELLKWMIITSDNTATNLIIDHIGMEKLNERWLEWGLSQTKLQRKMMDFEAINRGRDNFTSLKDMLFLFEGLYHHRLVSPTICEMALGILKQQRDVAMLKRYIVDDVVVAHKTAELYRLNHDVGIFYTDSLDYFIGIGLTNVYSNEEAYHIIGRLSKEIYSQLVKVVKA